MLRPVQRLLVAVVRLGETLLCSLPPRSVPALAWTLGTAWYAVDRRRRRRCRANLRAAFGEASPHSTEPAVRAVFRNMARVPLEAVWFPRMFSNAERVRARCTFLGDWQAFDDVASGGGVMFGGHLGNWELGAHALRAYPLPVSVVVRRFAQAGLERRLTASRGGAVIPHRTAMGGIRAALRAKRWVGILGDQNAGGKAQWIPFFGLPASTAGAPAWIPLEAGAPIFVGAVIRRRGDFAFELHVARIDAPSFADDPRGAVTWVLERYMAQLESWIRLAPTQYNWLHRRWKSRPAGEVPDPRLPEYDHHRPPVMAPGP